MCQLSWKTDSEVAQLKQQLAQQAAVFPSQKPAVALPTQPSSHQDRKQGRPAILQEAVENPVGTTNLDPVQNRL